MIELSKEVLEQILHEETAKGEDTKTILRAIYTRYMRMYEKYFEELENLDDGKIAELRKYHEETRSLIKLYYLDIPQDTCAKIEQFEEKGVNKLLGEEWRSTLEELYREFAKKYSNQGKSGEQLKKDFKAEAVRAFYETMEFIFRDGFGTESETARNVLSGIGELIFGK